MNQLFLYGFVAVVLAISPLGGAVRSWMSNSRPNPKPREWLAAVGLTIGAPLLFVGLIVLAMTIAGGWDAPSAGCRVAPSSPVCETAAR